MKLTLSVTLLTLFLAFAASGQEDCAFTLSKAQKLYDAGQIEQIQQMLQPCIKDGFNKEEIQTAQKLIIQTNLFDKNDKSADSAMLQFLKKYPEYEVVPSDQREFVQLFETYKTRPVIAVGIVGGINYSYIVNDAVFVADQSNYTVQMGIQGGVTFRKAIKNNFDASIDGIYMQVKYQYVGFDGETTTLTETQSCLVFPLSIIYTPFQFGKLSIFGRAGTTLSYLLSATGDISTTRDGFNPLTGITLTDLRNPFQVYGLLGVGMNFKIPHSLLQLDVKLNIGPMGQVSKITIEPTDKLYKSEYNYPTNDFKMHNLSFNIGWYYKFYSPRKK
jgi:hypothetical protein